MWTILTRISKNLVYAIPVMMLTGFVYGISFDAASLKSLIIPLTFLMVYPMMVTLKVRKVFEGGDWGAQFLAQVINFGFFPFLAFALGRIFFSEQPFIALGLLLAGLIPTSGMTISWTGFAGGNMEAAVKMTVIGLGLGSALTPIFVELLFGASIDVNLWAIFRQIIVIVFAPMLAGFITQTLLVKYYGQQDFQKRIAPKFPSISTLGVLAVIFIAVSLKAKAIYNEPGLIVEMLIPVLLLYGTAYTVSILAGRLLLNKKDGVALVYGTVMRNLSIALAVAINAFGPQGSGAALIIALAYIVQVQSASWSVRFIERFFKEEPESPLEAAVCE